MTIRLTIFSIHGAEKRTIMQKTDFDELLRKLKSSGSESRRVEAKRARGECPKKLWETLSAFSNSPDGGVILLGVDEAEGFSAPGVGKVDKVQAELESICSQMEPRLTPLVDVFEVDGEQVIVAEVPELPAAQKPCFYKAAGLTNGVFIRIAAGDRKATPYEVQALMEGRGQPRHDISPVLEASPNDLNQSLVSAFLAGVRGRASGPWRDRPDEWILRSQRILVEAGGRLVPSLAGWLCFADYPQSLYPQLSVSVVRYPTERAGAPGPGGERFLDNVLVEGPLASMVQETVRAVKRNIGRRAIVRGTYRQDVWEYPEEALREAVVNALVHRDLSPGALGSQVQVQIFPDRIEIRSPGGVFGGASTDWLDGPGTQASRNTDLVRLMCEITEDGGRKLCENRGSGIPAIVEALRTADLEPPDFQSDLSRFVCVFRNAPLIDADTIDWLASMERDAGIQLSDGQRRALAWMKKKNAPLDVTGFRRLSGTDAEHVIAEMKELNGLGVVRLDGAGLSARCSLVQRTDKNTDSTPGFGEDIRRIVASIGPKARREELWRAVVSICRIRRSSAQELASLLGGRDPGTFQRRHLDQMAAQGLLREIPSPGRRVDHVYEAVEGSAVTVQSGPSKSL